MLKITALVAVVGVTLAGCTGTTLDPSAQAKVQQALDTACPYLNTAQALVSNGTIALNKYQQAAMSTLALACPPNAPPTNGVVIASDIINAYLIIAPLVKK